MSEQKELTIREKEDLAIKLKELQDKDPNVIAIVTEDIPKGCTMEVIFEKDVTIARLKR